MRVGTSVSETRNWNVEADVTRTTKHATVFGTSMRATEDSDKTRKTRSKNKRQSSRKDYPTRSPTGRLAGMKSAVMGTLCNLRCERMAAGRNVVDSNTLNVEIRASVHFISRR
jgi:hypothetical protein